MNLKTLKETETSKVSLLRDSDNITKVYKEFFKEEKLNNELLFISLLDTAIKPEIKDNTLIYPYLTPLSDYLNRPIPEPEAVQLMEKCIDILDELISKNVVHRDIKAGNLYIDSERNLLISDFESALKGKGKHSERTCGTPGYMAPEQYKSPKVDWLADQYSFGAIFYKILTGNEAFSHESRNYECQSAITPDPSLDNPKLKVPFCEIVQRMLKPLKIERFQNIADIKAALKDCKNSSTKQVILDDKVIKISPIKKAASKSNLSKTTYGIIFLVVILVAILLKNL